MYELLDKQPEKLSSLKSLSVRKLPAPTKDCTDDVHDDCKSISFYP